LTIASSVFGREQPVAFHDRHFDIGAVRHSAGFQPALQDLAKRAI
jgi:hypothetical protein